MQQGNDMTADRKRRASADPLPGHLAIDAVPCKFHNPRPLLEVQGLLWHIAHNLRTRRDAKLLVLDKDVSQVQLPF